MSRRNGDSGRIMKHVTILDIPIHQLTKAETLEMIKGFVVSKKPHQVATVNPEFIVEAQANPEFKSTLQQTDLALADGFGVMLAAQYLGQPLPERIPGVDLVADLMQQAAARNWKVYLVGGQAGVATQAAKKLQQHHPGLAIVGAEEGIVIKSQEGNYIFNDRETSKLINSIVTKKPDILLVAFGAPKQDIFINQFKERLAVPVMIGVGGTFDFLAGRTKRAPRIFRLLGLEWLWRLFQEPRRFKRIYKAVILFPLKVMVRGRK